MQSGPFEVSLRSKQKMASLTTSSSPLPIPRINMSPGAKSSTDCANILREAGKTYGCVILDNIGVSPPVGRDGAAARFFDKISETRKHLFTETVKLGTDQSSQVSGGFEAGLRTKMWPKSKGEIVNGLDEVQDEVASMIRDILVLSM